MSGIEFEISTDLSVIENTVIECNYEELKEGLKELVAPYKNMIVSEDEISSAKADRAKLNKAAKSIADYRKSVKAVVMKPYEAFKEKCDVLESICKDASNNLDSQIKGFDNMKKQQKKEELASYYMEYSLEAHEYLPFEDFFMDRWLNATYPIEDAKQEIANTAERVHGDLLAIKSLNSEYEAVLLDMYKRTHNLSACIGHNARLMQAKRDAEVRQYEKTMPKPVEDNDASSEPPTRAVDERNDVGGTNTRAEDKNLYNITLAMQMTKSQMYALKNFLDMNGIAYKSVK